MGITEMGPQIQVTMGHQISVRKNTFSPNVNGVINWAIRQKTVQKCPPEILPPTVQHPPTKKIISG